MQAHALPLLMASKEARGSGEGHALDRIRMQKAVFLLVQRGSPAWRSLYAYEPYDWGPYSRDLSRDVDVLMSRGQLVIESVQGSRYGAYSTTATGEREVGSLWPLLTAEERAFIQAVRRYVTSKSFSDLLREVYAAYPRFAINSKFTG